MGGVNQLLVTRLDSVDHRLLGYLDEQRELCAHVVRRLRRYTARLLDGSMSPVALADEWPDWYRLVPVFVAAYVPEDMEVMGEEVQFLEAAALTGRDVHIAEEDRDYLTLLALQLDMYPELREGVGAGVAAPSEMTARATPKSL